MRIITRLLAADCTVAAGFARGHPKMAMARAAVRQASAIQRRRSDPVRPVAGDGEAGGMARMTGGGVGAGSGAIGVRVTGRTIGCGVPREAAVGARATRVSACRWPADGGLG